MKLPFPFLQNTKEEEAEYYLALLLTDEKVAAVILHESLGKLKLVSKHQEYFSSPLEESDLEELISIVDKTISKAEELLPPNIETHKTVFGVKDEWVDKETKKIAKDYLSKLKKVCDALDLAPIGFMIVTEAISHLLQQEEGAPLSAILAEIGHKSVTLTLLRGGKAVERIDGPIVESAPITVDSLLKHFTTAVLPARIILYDGKTTEKLSQQFITHAWSKSLPFLHVPQITVLPFGFDTKAVTYGAAAQMGFEVVGLDLTELKEASHVATPTEDQEETLPLETPEEDETEELPEEPIEEKTSTADHPEEKKEQQEEDETLPEPKPKVTSAIPVESFGFVSDQDITTVTPLPKVHEPVKHQSAIEEESNFREVDKNAFRVNLHQQESSEEFTNDELVKSKFPNIFGFLSHLKLPSFTLPSGGGKKRFILPLSIIVGLIALFGFLTYYYFNSVQAHIILSVKPKLVDEQSAVIFSGDSESDFSNDIIAAKLLETSVDGQATVDTTGKKDVGNKAKGTVTIYNSGSSSTKLENGAAIKASNGQSFLLDKDVTVASSSGDIFSGTKPGTTDVAVTAKDIGTEANLPSGTKFSIGSNSSLAAKNDSAFSGGSKKQVQVVSKNDVAKLRAELPNSLEAKAKEAIAQKAGSEETLLPFISVVSLDKAKFDNDVDAEAKKVKLTATVKFKGLAYENTELNNYAKSLLKGKYSQDISDKSIKNTVEDPEENKEGQVEAKLTMQAGLLPDIDTKDVVGKVEKMSLKDAQTFLGGLPQVAESKVTFSPSIPFLPNLLPRLPNNISIEVTTE